MNPCPECAGRGWGLRGGWIRRCEVCCRFEDDDPAMQAAAVDLKAYALRERPEAKRMKDGRYACPWCDYVPASGAGTYDRFADIIEALEIRRGDFVERDEEGARATRFEVDEEGFDDHDHLDPRIYCPRCTRTFRLPLEVDYG
jgi:hypothetical protein